MLSAAADIFHQAADLNRQDARRKGNVVHLQAGCEVIVTGDIHGNRTALSKIIAYAALSKTPHRRLVLQEIIHAPADERTGHDRSAELLLRAARLKIANPRQVLFVIGNHDVAQVTGREITKAGRQVCKQFDAGVAFAFGPDGPEVMETIKEFLLSLPLAIRCPNGVLIAHSLPAPRRMQAAGIEILSRHYSPKDLAVGGAVYEWTWGRGQTAEQLDALAEELKVDFFILGHHHNEVGYQVISPRALSIASDHNHGCVIRVPTDVPMTIDGAIAAIKPIAAIKREL